MFWMKGCPRCKGDLFLDQDASSRDVVCLQCGYRREISSLDLCRIMMDSEKRRKAPEQLMKVKQGRQDKSNICR